MTTLTKLAAHFAGIEITNADVEFANQPKDGAPWPLTISGLVMFEVASDHPGFAYMRSQLEERLQKAAEQSEQAVTISGDALFDGRKFKCVGQVRCAKDRHRDTAFSVTLGLEVVEV